MSTDKETEDDPLEVFLDAAEEADVRMRDAGYWRALKLVDEGQELFEAWYLTMTRARVLCGLARDRQVALFEAERAVEDAIKAGEACIALHALIAAYDDLGHPTRTLQAAARLPSDCFNDDLLFSYRFSIWNMQAAAAFSLRLDDDRPRDPRRRAA